MAESSAKSVDDPATGNRRRYGAQVVLLNSGFAPPDPSHLFDHDAWKSAEIVSTGRGSNWFVENDSESYVLRHFRRGGAVARILGNKYWFRSEEATRSFAEFNLLLDMRKQHLPVPEPMAAGYCKSGPWYTAQLLTRRIPDSQSWSAHLVNDASSDGLWASVGCTIAQLHRARVDHADLNAHNILVDSSGSIFIIDFDKGFKRTSVQGEWRHANLARLQRSLCKILPGQAALIESGWQQLNDSYEYEFARDSSENV